MNFYQHSRAQRGPFPWRRSLAAACTLIGAASAPTIAQHKGVCELKPNALPYELTFEVSGTPTSGGSIAFTTRIESESALARMTLDFEATGVTELTSDLDRELTDLPASGLETVAGTLDLTGVGTGQLELTIQYYEDGECGEETGPITSFFLHVFDDGDVVLTGQNSLLELRAERIEQRFDSGDLDTDEALEAYDGLLEAAGGGTGGMPTGSDPGATVRISGHVQWTDRNGGLHPSRYLTVTAYELGYVFDSELATTKTDAAGNYSIDIDASDLSETPATIHLRALSKSSAASVQTPSAFIIFGGRNYYMQRAFAGVSGGETYTNENFTVSNGTTPEGAFSIADCMNVTWQYIQTVNGTTLDTVVVDYPDSATSYSPGVEHINLLAGEAFSWDVLMHEYGHHIDNKFDLGNNPGGQHNLGDDLISIHGKDHGLRLGWAEAYATYLSEAAQSVTGAAALGVPLVADGSYTDLLAGFTFGIESRTMGPNLAGETYELNNVRAMWDLADAAADGDDQVSLGHPTVWTQIRNANPRTFSDGWNALKAGKTDAELLVMGASLSQNKVAAELTRPADGAAPGATPPNFQWRKNGLNEFELLFFDEATARIGSSGSIGNVSNWTPSQSEWDTIRDASAGSILWAVLGKNTTSTETGVYWSGARRLGGVDFAFVIDDTGSMSEEINGVRQGLLLFLSGFDPNSTDISFQLTTFKDNVYVRAPTSNLAEITAQVSSLSAGGGGYCPENSVGGLAQGTLALKRGGTVLFATDADPHAGSDVNGLIAQLRAGGVRVNVLLSGNCGGPSPLDQSGPSNSHYSNSNLYQGEDPGISSSTFESPWITEGPNTYGALDAVDAFSQVATATGGTFAFIPEVNFSADGTIAYQNAAENILEASVGPRVVLVSPSRLAIGAEARLTLKGQNTNFLSTTIVSFAEAGIIVLEIEVLDAVTISMRVRVETTATEGFIDLQATTELTEIEIEEAPGKGVLQLIAAPLNAVLTSAAPSILSLGQMATIELEGLNTNFVDDISAAFFGHGITVIDVNVTSPTRMLVDIQVLDTAIIGFRSPTVTTELENAGPIVLDLIRVQAAPPAIPSVASLTPSTESQGETFDMNIEVENLSTEDGAVNVEFSGTGITVESIVVCGTGLVATVTITADAPLGARDVLVSADGVVATSVNGFTIGEAGSTNPGAGSGGSSDDFFDCSSCSSTGSDDDEALLWLLLGAGLLGWMATRQRLVA